MVETPKPERSFALSPKVLLSACLFPAAIASARSGRAIRMSEVASTGSRLRDGDDLLEHDAVRSAGIDVEQLRRFLHADEVDLRTAGYERKHRLW